jgi:hypothetical protein
MIDESVGFVTDWAEGDRDPGLVQQAVDNSSTIDPARWQASLKYMDELVKMHNIPIEAFAHTEAGQPVGANAIALTHYERNYSFLAERAEVDAAIEFFTIWLRRNVPQHRARASFVTGDCGQFLNVGEEITAILDMEVGHIGDGAFDLGCFRGRHPVENMGDVPALLRRYAETKGEPLDLPVIAYHTVNFLAMAMIPARLAMIDDYLGGSWVEGLMQVVFCGRRACDALADLIGVQLDRDMSLPPPHVAPYEDAAFQKLDREIAHLPVHSAFQPWERDIMRSLCGFLKNEARYGRWIEEEDLREIGEILGERPRDLADAESRLKAFVREAEPEMDGPLLQLIHRRLFRQCLLLAGADAPRDHLLLIPVEPLITVAARNASTTAHQGGPT